MSPRRVFLLLLVGCLVLAAQIPVMAQTNAGLRGQVLDKDGAPIPGATLTLKNPTLGISQGAVTDGKGEFRIVPLAPGRGYSLTVQFPGMTKVIVEIELTPNRVTFQPITLRPESELRQSIKVTARTDVVNTETTTTQTTYSSEFIDSLPILGRNYQDVLTLAPGVSDTDGDGNPNIHGARDVDVVTLVDGVSTVDPLTGQRGQELNLDSIQEIEVKTSGASAEFSRGQGGFVSIVTKSGGNDFEGSFRFLWRGDLVDGDGAGIDDPALHGGLGESGLRDLSFNDFNPALSLAGPIKRDKAWYFLAAEYIQEEEPINALTQAFIETRTETRIFGKLTWDMSTSHKLVFTATYDPQEFENQGLNSFRPIETGTIDTFGGLNLVLKETAVFSPNAFLETTVQRFKSSPDSFPTIDPDTNGNDILFIDWNNNGFNDATERDPGEDFDGDRKFDVFEDINGNGFLDIGEDRDQDGRVTPLPLRGPLRILPGGAGVQVACEGQGREDWDCDGHLDFLDEDLNMNGILDPGEDIDNDGRLDSRQANGVFIGEDHNGNFILDDRPGHIEFFFNETSETPGDPCSPSEDDPTCVPFVLPGIDANPNGEFLPYGRRFPTTPDRNYAFDQNTFRFSGPFNSDFTRDVGRTTLRQDLTLFVQDWHGQHDIKIGARIERESYGQTTSLRPFILDNVGIPNSNELERAVGAFLPTEPQVFNEASSTTFGMYVEDTYKPLPNLTIKVGFVFDREATDSFGFTPFDPAAERALFDRISFLAGGERKILDQSGNGDGIHSQGFCSDPLFTDLPGNVCEGNTSNNPFVTELQKVPLVAKSRLTQHHFSTALVARDLVTLFPEAVITDPITGRQTIDVEVLRERGSATFQEEEPFRLTNNNLAPRLSVSWDPWGDSKTRLFANWARLYDKIFLNAVILEEGPNSVSRYYLQDRDGVTGGGIPNAGFGTTKSKSPPNFSQVDRGLQTPFTDELSFGFEREIAPEVSLKMTYISRNARNGLQDRDINHSVRLDENGEMLDVVGILTGGGGTGGAAQNRRPDGKPDLYINNFFFNQIFRLGNFNESRYRAIEVQVTKRLSRKWQMEGSYSYSRALGDAEDFQSLLGDDPATLAQEFGPLDFDERHVVKLNAITFLPGDWQLGTTMSWSSGLPFTVITSFAATDNFDFLQQRRLFGRVVADPVVAGGVFVPEQRNSRRNDPVYQIDVKATKSFVLGNFNSKLFLTVENLLNTDDLRIFTFDPDQPNRAGLLQLNSQRDFGRRFEIGFQFEF